MTCHYIMPDRRPTPSELVHLHFASLSTERTMSSSSTPISASNPLKKYKLVFLGEQSVGKTSLITRFVRRLDDASIADDQDV
jgi:hypothetical protein